jgi:hypothetical protein
MKEAMTGSDCHPVFFQRAMPALIAAFARAVIPLLVFFTISVRACHSIALIARTSK